MKNHIIISLEKAKEAHLSQLGYIQLLVKGVEIKESAIDRYQSDCLLGIWLENEGEKLKPYCGSIVIDEVRVLLASWYEEYRKIYEIFFTKKVGFFRKFFDQDIMISQLERDKATLYVRDLEKISEQMLTRIDTIHRKIAALGITHL